MNTVDKIIEWSEHCDILDQYWLVGIVLAVLILAWCLYKWIIE